MTKKKIEKKKSIILILVIIVLVIVTLFFYFNRLVQRERLESEKKIERLILESGKLSENSIDNQEQTSPETLNRLRESGISRYFLSEIDLINNSYMPIINTCLYRGGLPIYPLYVHETWSSVNYPEEKPEFVLVRYLLLPEDNNDFKPNKTCYIKEIKDEEDWKEIERYNFYKNLFN